jgi:hypothetical protein
VTSTGGYSVPSTDTEDPIGQILAGRRESLERSAAGLARLIEERAELRETNLASIDENVLAVRNLVHAMYRPGQPATDNPFYNRLRLEELRLDRDRRNELNSWWRDTIDVAKELGAIAERIEVARRNEILLRGDGL